MCFHQDITQLFEYLNLIDISRSLEVAHNTLWIKRLIYIRKIVLFLARESGVLGHQEFAFLLTFKGEQVSITEDKMRNDELRVAFFV